MIVRAVGDDLGLKLVAGGWPREFCALCHWELNADGVPEHAAGYTNGLHRVLRKALAAPGRSE